MFLTILFNKGDVKSGIISGLFKFFLILLSLVCMAALTLHQASGGQYGRGGLVRWLRMIDARARTKGLLEAHSDSVLEILM